MVIIFIFLIKCWQEQEQGEEKSPGVVWDLYCCPSEIMFCKYEDVSSVMGIKCHMLNCVTNIWHKVIQSKSMCSYQSDPGQIIITNINLIP